MKGSVHLSHAQHITPFDRQLTDTSSSHSHTLASLLADALSPRLVVAEQRARTCLRQFRGRLRHP